MGVHPVELRQATHLQCYIEAGIARGTADERFRRAAERSHAHRNPARLSRPVSAPQLHRPTELRLHAAQRKRSQLQLEQEQRYWALASQQAGRELQASVNADAEWQARLDRFSELQDKSAVKVENAQRVRREQQARQHQARFVAASHRSRRHTAHVKALEMGKQATLQEKQQLREERAREAWRYRQAKASEEERRLQVLDETWQQRREELDWEEARKEENLDEVKAFHKKVLTEKHALQVLLQKCSYMGNYDPVTQELSGYRKRMGLDTS